MPQRVESRANRLVKHLRKLGASRAYRAECGAFLCDGPKLLEEARRSDADIREILIDEAAYPSLLGRFPWLEEAAVTLAAPGILESASAVETNQGILFSCGIPERAVHGGSRFILLDCLQDTGNLGTIIRCADAFGIDAVLSEGSADPWNPKTVRAAMGALFRVPVASVRLQEAVAALQEEGVPVYVAILDRDAVPVTRAELGRCAVIVGNEGRGVRGELAELADRKIHIPMPGAAESLNAAVAAAILMWEMAREKI